MNMYRCIKNTESLYLDMDLSLVKLVGWKKSDQYLGKSDFDMPCQAAEFAAHFIKQDQMAFNMPTDLITLDIQNYKNGWKTLIITRKKIIYDNQDCLLAEANDISETTLANYYKHLFIKDYYFEGKLSAKSYILNSHANSWNLTQKQEMCLYYLLRGNSIKQIAAKLNLSPRTIEDHVNALKNKFNCNNKQQLIERAVENGFLIYLPKMHASSKIY